MKQSTVPVFRYHSIGIRNPYWVSGHLTCPFEKFENQLKWLKSRNYSTITLLDLYNHMKYDSKIPKKSIVLTFDDGFVDNWIFTYPLLKKYGFQATIYVSPEFVNPINKLRYNLDNEWYEDIQYNDLDSSGYLSWEEMKIMEEDGIVDIQSHSMTHSWVPKNPTIIDFRYPKDPYIWLTWNQNIERKPFLQLDDENLMKLGQPVYDNDRALACRKYIPNDYFDQIFIDYVRDQGGLDFFSIQEWKKKLFNIINERKLNLEYPGKYETDAEYENRLFYVLEFSKKTIEKKLNKQVQFFCWPGGAASKEAKNIANNLGYLSSNIPKDERNRKSGFKNRYGEEPKYINRRGTGLYWDNKEKKSSKIIHKNGFQLILDVNRNNGGSKSSSLISSCILGFYYLFYKFFFTMKSVKT